MQVSLSLWEVSNPKTVISPPIQNLAHQVFGELPKPVKMAQIDPQFFLAHSSYYQYLSCQISRLSDIPDTCFTTSSPL
jgi:hypothetical protein